MKSLRIIYRAIRQFDQDGASQMGAALAYYALFSTAPLLILAVMVAGLFFGEDAARAQVEMHLSDLIDDQKTRAQITDMMNNAIRPVREQGTLAAILGGAFLLLGALTAFLHVRRCLCTIWRLELPRNGLVVTLLNYSLAAIMVLCMGALLLLSLAVSTAIPLIAEHLKDELVVDKSLWRWVDVGVSFVLLTLFFGLVVRVMSARRIAWMHVLYGAFITAVLFTIGKVLISYYLAYTTTASAYGAAGSLVVFLIWVYYSSQIFFFGAELVQARRSYEEWRHPAGTTS